MAAADKRLLAGKDAAFCWLRIWLRGIPRSPGWPFWEALGSAREEDDDEEEVGEYIGLLCCWVPIEFPIPGSSWESLYWWRGSVLLVEGLEGIAGLGDPIADLGERGGTFMVPHGAWCPEGIAKFPWSEEVEDERER